MDSDTASHSGAEALRSDAQKYAEVFGVSPEEAYSRLEDQTVAGDLLQRVSSIAGDRYAGGWIENEPTWRVQVRLTEGRELTAVHRLLANSGLPVEVAYSGTVSEADLVAAATALAATYAGDTEGVDGVEVDIMTGELVVLVNPIAESLSEVTTSSAEVAARTIAASIPVRIERTDAPATDSNRGGVLMSTCTAGFTVRGSSATGLATAGHCGSTQSYATSPSGSASNSAPFITESRTSSADVQWHTTPNHSDVGQFYGDYANSATVRTGSGVAAVGQLLCHRGKVTGYTCGNVTSTAYAPTYSGACPSTCSASFVRVEGSGLGNLQGDSGGPWFAGGTAYGIHKGGQLGEVAVWACFTPVARLSNLGVSLL